MCVYVNSNEVHVVGNCYLVLNLSAFTFLAYYRKQTNEVVIYFLFSMTSTKHEHIYGCSSPCLRYICSHTPSTGSQQPSIVSPQHWCAPILYVPMFNEKIVYS